MGEHTAALNRKAYHEYTIEEHIEAGIALTGTEIKSIRAGKVSLQESYARIERGEAWLIGVTIAPFAGGNRFNHEPRRTRKLLLHRKEIDELLGRTRSKGLTLVPLRLYIDEKGHAKVELGLARGKQLHDKRRAIADRDAKHAPPPPPPAGAGPAPPRHRAPEIPGPWRATPPKRRKFGAKGTTRAGRVRRR